MKNRIKLGNMIMGILTLIILIMAGSIANEAKSQTSLRSHRKLQKENTFENRMKTNESFTKKSLKEDNKTLKAILKQKEKKNGDTSKMEAIKEENAELRSRIEEIEIN